ncbi:MAG TPA: DNA translocase FtsK [Terracidiphilus sp.]|jgi:S-DNA-T family DNA segregation ATPase FtsK/SpoIIIE|nr:DNA translocase FtsK [Terracidiphilus sp.]
MKSIPIALSPTRSRALNLFLGVMLAMVALLLFLALSTYHPADPSLNTATDAALPHAVHNWAGLFGAWLSDLLLQAIGITALLLPVWLGGLSWDWMRSRSGGSAWLRWGGCVLAIAFLPTVFGLLPWHWHWMHAVPVEGVIGRLIAGVLVVYLNTQGAWVVAAALAAVGVYFATAVSIWTLKQIAEDRWIHLVALYERWRNWREDRADARAERDSVLAEQQSPGPDQRLFTGTIDAASDPASGSMPKRVFSLASLFSRKPKPVEVDPLDEIPAFQRAASQPAESQIPVAPVRRSSIWERTATDVAPATPGPVPVPTSVPAASVATRPIEFKPLRPAPPPTPEPVPQPPAVEQSGAPGAIAIHERADADVRTVTVPPKHVSGFKLPASTLLNSGSGPQAVREDELREEARVLVEKCAEFDVRGQVVQINPGPMVTTYEFKPEAGVKYSRVTGLAEDLCLAMRAESILIERMAGKSTVGIQVPNHERETIHLRDVIESETFSRARSRLTLAMGKDINGRIVTADLASMPHVLIAGSTGSGKSVAINAMIMSLLFRTTPSQVRLILVDPKRVELGMYEGIPHLFTPIITEPKLAANALRNAVREMERRLKLLASRSVRNIDQYNKLFEGTMPSLFDEGEPEEPLPYIVIIIDELADLMMLDRANVEESITRLAQMARAVGIHLILATQRPSVDVITGLIKANVPTRISFRLATKVDSRTILDTNGAEALLGRGDMLFLPPGTSRLMRLHAPFVSEKETAAVVAFWKEQGAAEYAEGFLESPREERPNQEGSSGEADDDDPMFDDAVRLVFEFGKASTSLLQRRLRVGYGRAAHLIDLMERDGLVGPADGSRPRELLKAPGWLHEVSVADE